MLEDDIVREYSRIEDILEGDDDSGLKSLIRKHERWLKTETIKDHHCKVVHLSCKEFCKNRNNSTPFVDLIQRELQQSREMFIIRPHPECQTPLRKSFDESKVDEITSVDSLSYMKYAPLTSVDKGFIFRRVLKDEPMKYALNKIQEKTGSDSINIGNLRKINSQTSMHDLSEDTTLYDFDFKHNWEVVSRESIQIENVGCLPSLSNPEPHYLQPSCLISPLSALSFKPDNGVAGVTSSYTYCGLPGASTAMHNEDLNFASFNQNLGNGKKGWVSSLFNHSSLMWNLLMQYNNDYPDRKDLCRAHFRKKADFIFLTQLKEWDVGFKIAIQLPGDIVVTPTGVSHQVTTVDYTFNEAINFCDNLWFKPQTNFLKLCKNVTKHNEAHGHNYDSLVKTSNFRPEFLQHKWEIWQNENISRTNFEPINYEECQMCNPSPPEPKTNDTSSKDPIAIDIPSLIVSSAGLLSYDNAGAESAALEQNNRKIPCTTKNGQHWTELAEAVVLISPLKITNYLSEGKYLIKQSRPQDLDTKLISISNVNDPPSTSTTHIEVDRRPYSGMKNAKQLVVAIESLATTGPRDSIGSNSEIDSTTTTAKTSPPPIKSLPTTKRARGRPFKIHLTAGTEETLRAIKRLPTVRKRKATGNPHWAKIKNSQISLAASQSQGITTTKRGRGRPRKGEVTAQTKKLTTIHVTKNTKKSLSALQGVRLQPTSTEGRNVQKPEIKSAAQIDSLTTSLTSSPTTTRESVGGNSETEIPTGNKLVPGTGIKSPTTHQEAPCTKANTAELPQQLVADIKSPVEQALLEVVESKSKISKLVATSQNSQVNVQPSQNKKENQIRTIREPPTTISSTPENAKPKMEKTLTILLSRIQIPIPNPAPVQNTVVPNNARRENRKARFNNKFSQFNSRLASQTSKLVEIRRKAQELSTLSSHTKAITANRSRTKAKQPQPLRITSRQFSRSPSITQISRRNRIGNTAKKATPLVTVTSSGLGTSLNNIRHNSNINDKDSANNSSTVTELRSPSSAKNCILTPVEYANAESQTDQSLKLTQFQLLSSSSASAKAATLQDHSLHKEDERAAHNFPATVHVTPDTTQRDGTTAQDVLHFHSPAKSTNQIDLRIESPISSTNNNASQNNIDEQELANSERQKQNVRSLVNTSTSITSSANTKEITEQTEPKNPKQNYSILSTMKTRSSVVDDDEVSFLCIVQGKKPKHGAHSPTPRRTHLNSSAVTLEEAAATTTRTRKPSKLVRSRSSASNSNMVHDANGKRVPVESRRRKHKVKNPKKILKESKNLPLPVKNPLATAVHNTTPPRVTQATAPAPATELVSLLLQSPVPITVQSDGLGTNQREKRARTKKVCPCCTTSSVKAEPEIDPGTVHNFSEAEQLASPSPTAAATRVSRSAQEIHSAILRALCHICGKSFSNIDALHSHLQSKHADWREMEGNRHERNIPGHNSEFSSLENDVKRCSPNKKSDLNVTLPSHRQFRNRIKRRRKGKKKTDRTKRKEKSKKLRHKELLSSYEEPTTTHPFCEKSFDSKYHVSDTHPHTEISPPIMEFHCECGKAYKHRSDLLRHIRHGKSRSTFKCVESSNTSRRGKHASRSPRRRKIDPKMEELTVRMAKVGFLEEDDDASLDQSSSSQPKERGENSQRTRLEELLYPIVRPTCNLCQKSFLNKYVRDAHVHVTHSTVKKFQCICGLKYKNRSDLRRHQKHQRLKEINDSGYNSDCWKKSKAPHSSHRSVQTINLTFRNELKRKASIGELVEGAEYDSVPNSGDHQPTPNSNLNTISNHVIKTQTQAKSTAPRCKTKKRKTRRTSAQKSSAPLPRHMCHLCENSFKDKNRLDYHVKFTHSSVKRFKCECGKAYKHASDLRRHQKESELYACQSDSDDQEPSPTNSNLNTTLNIAIETQTKDTQLTATCSKIKNSLEEESVSPLVRPTCHLCGKSFKNKIVLRSHLNFTHSKIRQFQCHCGKTYKSPSDLARHRKKQRSKNVNDAGYNSDCLKFSIVPRSRHLLRTLQTLSSTLEEPKRETSNGDLVEDTVCDSAPTPSSSSSHVNGTHSQVKFQCNCGKIYKSRSGLQRHRKKQRSKTVNDKGYNLDCMRSCNVSRNTRPKTKIQNGNTRRTSLQEILGKLKRSTCHLCEKSFKNKYALDCHVKFTHSPNVNVEKVTKTGQT